MTDTPIDPPELPQGTDAPRITKIPEGSLWTDDDKWYVFRDGKWVELTGGN